MGRETKNEKRNTKSMPPALSGRHGWGRTSAGSGARVVYVGGNANNGANDGVGYVNLNNGLSNANANIGARLATQVTDWSSFSSTVETGGLRWPI